MPGKSIVEVLQAHTEELMAMKGVEGVAEGICKGKPCIRIFISKKVLQIAKNIPEKLDGYTVCIEETGKFKALN